MKLHEDQRGAVRSIETIAVAALMAVVGAGLKAPLERAVGKGVPAALSESLTFTAGDDGAAAGLNPASAAPATGDAEYRAADGVTLTPLDATAADAGPPGATTEGAGAGDTAAGGLGASGPEPAVPAPSEPDVGEQILATLPAGALGRRWAWPPSATRRSTTRCSGWSPPSPAG